MGFFVLQFLCMKNSQKFVIGNWKMKITSLAQAKKLFTDTKKEAGKHRGVQTIVCPPAFYLEPLSKMVTGHRCVLGAQNIFHEEVGAFTGELSPLMLADRKIGYSIIGHSERRAMGETSEDVSKKIRMCIKNGIIPIVCVGETERKDDNSHYKVIKKQIKESFAGIPYEALGSILLAYEPVWALSSTKDRHDATPQDAEEMKLFVQKVFADMYGVKKIENLTFLYGGSVDADNVADFMKEKSVDGVLVGSASVDSKEFAQMLKVASSL